MSKRVIRRAKSIKFQGRLFCVPKKDSDKLRVILDLSPLNKFIENNKFRMLNLQHIKTLMPKRAYTVLIEMADAYWHIPINCPLSSYLGFRLQKKKYIFRTMPFGLNIAPRIFTKLADAVVQLLRLKCIQLLAYLDDWLVWAASKTECMQASKKVIQFLEHLGFKINVKKSRLSPAQEFQWLGIHWNLKSHLLSIPPGKRREIAGSVKKLLKSDRISRRQQDIVLGSLQFASVTDPVLRAQLKDASGIWRRYTSNARRDLRRPIPT